MEKVFYRFEISERDDCYLILENGELRAICGSMIDVDLWLEDHATSRGLSPEYYELTYLPKPLKSDEIIERTLGVCDGIHDFDEKPYGIPAIHWFSKYIVELNETKIWLDSLEITAQNCNTIDNCKLLIKHSIYFGESMIRHIASRYVL